MFVMHSLKGVVNVIEAHFTWYHVFLFFSVTVATVCGTIW